MKQGFKEYLLTFLSKKSSEQLTKIYLDNLETFRRQNDYIKKNVLNENDLKSLRNKINYLKENDDELFFESIINATNTNANINVDLMNKVPKMNSEDMVATLFEDIEMRFERLKAFSNIYDTIVFSEKESDFKKNYVKDELENLLSLCPNLELVSSKDEEIKPPFKYLITEAQLSFANGSNSFNVNSRVISRNSANTIFIVPYITTCHSSSIGLATTSTAKDELVSLIPSIDSINANSKNKLMR